MFSFDLQPCEIPGILDQLGRYCETEYGRMHVTSLPVITSRDDIAAETDKIRKLAGLERAGQSPSPDGVEFVDNVIEKCAKASFLTEDELGRLVRTVHAASAFMKLLASIDPDGLPDCSFPEQRRFDSIRDRFAQYMTDTGFIRRNATPKLQAILDECERIRTQIHVALETIIAGKRKALREEYVTLRDGRFVLLVKAAVRREVPGATRDISQSGDTFFVEPAAVAGLNERHLVALKRAENEKTRILTALTSVVRDGTGVLRGVLSAIGYYDSLLARAKYMLASDLAFPELSAGRHVVLKKAVHSTYLGGNAVANDFVIQDDTGVWLVTGPNGGGKTVALKTVSSIIILSQMAVPVALSPGSKTAVFDRLFFDLGDTQNMAAGTSSFTSKMLRWKEIIAEAGEGTLVVVDELGNFTNPVEGAALSCALISELRRKGALLLAGTHLDQVKEFVAALDGAQVASMAWDEETHSPRYSIRYGVLSGSFAIDVARTLGFETTFLDECEKYMSHELGDLAALRGKYEAALADLDRREADLLSVKVEYGHILERQKQELGRIASEARRDATLFEDRVNGLLAEFERRLAEQDISRRSLSAAAKELRGRWNRLAREYAGSGAVLPVEPGSRVFVHRFGQEGKVIAVDGDKVTVAVGSLKIEVHADELRTAVESGGPVPVSSRCKPQTWDISGTSTGEIDLRGRKVDEAIELLDKEIDNVVLAGGVSIKIIHGAGPGGLRAAVHEYLKGNPRVRTFTTGGYLDRGGSYVTTADIGR